MKMKFEVFQYGNRNVFILTDKNHSFLLLIGSWDIIVYKQNNYITFNKNGISTFLYKGIKKALVRKEGTWFSKHKKILVIQMI